MDDNSKALVPHMEKVVDFYGDQIPVAQDDEGEIYVPLRPLATFLGLNVSGQRQRVLRDRVMGKRARLVMMKGGDGKLYEQLCLPLDLLPGWLFGVTTGKMSAELAAKLDRYREEGFRVLWRAFRDEILPAVPQPTNMTPAEQMLEQAEALYKIAQQQVAMERGLAEVRDKQQAIADYMRPFVRDTRQQLGQHESRLTALELRLEPANTINEAQATQLTLAVKNVAYAMGGAGGDYGKVYSELYRRFEITTYHNLKRDKFDEAMAWLADRFTEIEKRKKELAGEDATEGLIDELRRKRRAKKETEEDESSGQD